MSKTLKEPVKNRGGGQKYKLGRTTLTITVFQESKDQIVEASEKARTSVSRFVEDLVMRNLPRY